MDKVKALPKPPRRKTTADDRRVVGLKPQILIVSRRDMEFLLLEILHPSPPGPRLVELMTRPRPWEGGSFVSRAEKLLDANADKWWQNPCMWLDHQVPVEMLKTEEGRENLATCLGPRRVCRLRQAADGIAGDDAIGVPPTPSTK